MAISLSLQSKVRGKESRVSLPIAISLAALLISFISLGFSIYLGLRDRYKLVTESKFFSEDEYGPAVVQIKIVNAGRRVVVLRVLGGNHIGGGSSGEILGEERRGYPLNEQEAFERRYVWETLHSMSPDGTVDTYESLYVEDTLGRRYKIRDSKKNIKKLLATGKNKSL